MMLITATIVAVPIAWLALELRAIRLALLAPAPQPDARLEEDGCLHPQELRTDSSTSGTWRWRCDPKKGGCGFEHEQSMRPIVDAVTEQLARDLTPARRMPYA